MKFINIMEEFKIGDWVVVTERYASNSALAGDLSILKDIDVKSTSRAKWLVKPEKEGGITTWCKNIRKATPEEIEKHTGISVESVNYEIY